MMGRYHPSDEKISGNSKTEAKAHISKQRLNLAWTQYYHLHHDAIHINLHDWTERSDLLYT